MTIDNTHGTTQAYLGQFTILTAVSFPQLPADNKITLGWTDSFGDSGTVTLSIIPEPASVILLGIGVGVPIIWHIRRRRRASGEKQT